jgi:hypothetical protein
MQKKRFTNFVSYVIFVSPLFPVQNILNCLFYYVLRVTILVDRFFKIFWKIRKTKQMLMGTITEVPVP